MMQRFGEAFVFLSEGGLGKGEVFPVLGVVRVVVGQVGLRVFRRTARFRLSLGLAWLGLGYFARLSANPSFARGLCYR